MQTAGSSKLLRHTDADPGNPQLPSHTRANPTKCRTRPAKMQLSIKYGTKPQDLGLPTMSSSFHSEGNQKGNAVPIH